MSTDSDNLEAPGAGIRAGWWRWAAVALVGVALAALAWLLLGSGGGGSGDSAGVPRIATPAQLGRLAAAVGHPVYWAGPRGQASLELTHQTDGQIYVRYLTGGARPGDPRPSYLTVGTYPNPNPEGTLRRAAANTGGTVRRAPGGAIALVDPNSPSSVYLAYPGSAEEVEVFDPSPRRALQVVLSGRVRPVPER